MGLLLCQAAESADTWIVRGNAPGPGHDCSGLRWTVDAILHNRTGTTAAIRALHVSNGGNVSADSALLPAHSSEASSVLGVGGVAGSGLWVTKLDVPPGILAEGRLETFAVDLCNPGHPPATVPLGKIALPVFTSLVPANTEQVHLGTDLAAQDVRLNVAVYNASAFPAVATITLMQPFCARLASTTSATVPSDSIVQVAVPDVHPCLTGTGLPSTPSYVTVVADQPGFSFVSVIANGVTPTATHAVIP